MSAAVVGGAQYVGLVFYPPSPRAVEIKQAAGLAEMAHKQGLSHVVGVFADQGCELIRQVLSSVELDMIQLHGSENVSQIAQIREKCGLPVIKALQISTHASLQAILDYEGVADYLLLDAKPPAHYKLPGGSGHPIDWKILKQVTTSRPWFLAGGLTADNLRQALSTSGARRVDVSSGLEHKRGLKNPLLIEKFLACANSSAEHLRTHEQA